MDDLRRLLEQSAPNDLANLATILHASDSSVESILEAFQWNALHTAQYYLGYRKSYLDIVKQVADQLDVSYPSDVAIEQLEATIIKHALQKLWDNLSVEQRAALEEEWKQSAQGYDKLGSAVTGGSILALLTVAQLSGFTIYMGASTLVGAMTAAVGTTLPFAFYTTMSSTIAVLIGPVGWLGAGLYTVWMLNTPSYKRLVPAVLYVCMLRAKRSLGGAVD